jgi:hypothetical protein
VPRGERKTPPPMPEPAPVITTTLFAKFFIYPVIADGSSRRRSDQCA